MCNLLIKIEISCADCEVDVGLGLWCYTSVAGFMKHTQCKHVHGHGSKLQIYVNKLHKTYPRGKGHRFC